MTKCKSCGNEKNWFHKDEIMNAIHKAKYFEMSNDHHKSYAYMDNHAVREYADLILTLLKLK